MGSAHRNATDAISLDTLWKKKCLLAFLQKHLPIIRAKLGVIIECNTYYLYIYTTHVQLAARQNKNRALDIHCTLQMLLCTINNFFFPVNCKHVNML